MKNSEQLKRWFATTQLAKDLKTGELPLDARLVERIAIGAAMLAYEQGVIDGVRDMEDHITAAMA